MFTEPNEYKEMSFEMSFEIERVIDLKVEPSISAERRKKSVSKNGEETRRKIKSVVMVR